MPGINTPCRGSLLGLSPDLRRMIFEYAFPNRRTVEVGSSVSFFEPSPSVQAKNPRPGMSLLYVCKQISEECLDILYGWNAFEVRLHEGGEETLAQFPAVSRNRIKYIAIVARPAGDFFMWSSPSLSLWRPILANLETIQFCFNDHIHDLPPDPEESEKQEQFFLRWEDWITPYLDCFSQYVRPNAEIDNIHISGPRTFEMLNKYFTPSLRMQSDHTQRLHNGTAPWWKSRPRRGFYWQLDLVDGV